MIAIIAILAGIVLYLGAGLAWGDFAVAERGQARASIVIGAEATATECHAARELADYVEKMTGARLPIRTVGRPPVGRLERRGTGPRPIILVGRAETNPLVKQLVDEGVVRLSAEEPGLDGYIIQTVGNGQQATGNGQQATSTVGAGLAAFGASSTSPPPKAIRENS